MRFCEIEMGAGRFYEIVVGAGSSRVLDAMVVDTTEFIGISSLIPQELLRAATTTDNTIDLKILNTTKPTTAKSGSYYEAFLC